MNDLFSRALALAQGQTASASAILRVAQQTSDEAARWAFTQWELRVRAEAKFSRASEMLFVREALEQATHEELAAYHASRFPPGERALDVTTGIGADLIALAARGPAVGYELDPERAECARHNLGVAGLGAEVRVEDSLAVDWDADFVWADPARRSQGRRTLSFDELSPDPRVLAARMRALRRGGLKLSPMMRDADLESLGPQVEFVSFQGECREALVWTGGEVSPEAARWAVHVRSGQRLLGEPRNAAGDSEPRAFIAEADPAAIRAHALPELSRQTGWLPLGESMGYLTRDEDLASPWVLHRFELLETVRFDPKVIQARLRAHDEPLESIKHRGLELDHARLQKVFGVRGVGSLVLLVYPGLSGVKAALVRRIRS